MEIADAERLMNSLRASSLSLSVCAWERDRARVRAYYLPTNICYFQYLRDLHFLMFAMGRRYNYTMPHTTGYKTVLSQQSVSWTSKQL